MSARKRRQFIPSLKRDDGTMAWKHEEKQQVLDDYYVNLIGKKVRRLRSLNWPALHLTSLQQVPGLELDRPFNEDEVLSVVRSLPSGKAPGPDGFTNDFYKACWDIIKGDVMNAFSAFYIHHNGALEHLNKA